MANLMECDRCKMQWNPANYADKRTDIDLMRCVAVVSGPRHDRKARPAFSVQVDLCQDCAEALREWLTARPGESNGTAQ